MTERIHDRPLAESELFDELAMWHSIAEELAANPDEYTVEEGVTPQGHEYIKIVTKEGSVKAYADLTASRQAVEEIVAKQNRLTEVDKGTSQNSAVDRTYLHCVRRPDYLTVATKKNGGSAFLHELTPETPIIALRIYQFTPTGPKPILQIHNPSDPLLLDINGMVQSGWDPTSVSDFSEYQMLKFSRKIDGEYET